MMDNQSNAVEPVKKKSRTVSIVFFGLSMLIGLLVSLTNLFDGLGFDWIIYESGLIAFLSLLFIVSILIYSNKLTMLGSVIGAIGFTVDVIILFSIGYYGGFPDAFFVISGMLWVVFFALYTVKNLTNKMNDFILITVAVLAGVFDVLGGGISSVPLYMPFTVACVFLVLNGIKGGKQTP